MLRLFAGSIVVAIAASSFARQPTTLPTTGPTTRLADQGGSAPLEPPAGMAVYVGDELLRDYRPRSTLVTPAHFIAKGKFPVVDIHCHWTRGLDPAAMLSAMDSLNVRYAVNLSGGYGPACFEMLDKFAKPSDGRLIIFANLDFAQIDDPQFGVKMVSFLEEAHQRGAMGLKIFKTLGLTVQDHDGKVVPIDDARLDPIWDACARLDMPVLIHSADPIAFFSPVDETNERWMQLKRHPDWSFADRGKFPTWEEVIAQRNRVIAKHRATRFIVAHMAESSNDYVRLGRWLDENPNLVVDLSGRDNEIGRQPRTSRAFFVKYADRILFGTDRYPGRLDQPRYHVYFRMLETDDECFDYYDNAFPPSGEWKIYGLGLPDDVLEKVYGGNARRVLKLP
jgi:uncharacterized protein